MQRAEAIQYLTEHRKELREQFGVTSLALFGSTARNEATSVSDVDLWVTFDRPTGLFALMCLQLYLEALLGVAVDVGTLDGFKPCIRERVLAESIYVS